jgi:uroporphyrinogen-III synthase
MRILLTRPREDAEALAATLRARGHEVTIEPLFIVFPVDDGPIDLNGVQAVLLTSANGARALAQRTPRRDVGVLAVGDATAATARALGFEAVESAGGDVEDLARLARARLRPEGGVLLHAAGSVVAGDLAGQLSQAGFIVRRTVLYRAKPVETLSADVAAALRTRSIDMVVFFSPRNAANFVKLLNDHALTESCAHTIALGLSPAVIAAADGVAWGAKHSAEQPNETALLDTIDRLALSYAPPQMTTIDLKPALESPPEPAPASGPWDASAATTPEVPSPQSDAPKAEAPFVAPPPPPATPRHAPGLSGVAVVALLLAAAGLGWSLWKEFGAPPPSAPVVTPAPDLTPRLTAIERQIAALGQPQPDARVAAIGERLAGIERRLGEIAAAPAPVPAVTPDQIAALQRRLDALQVPQIDVAALGELRAETTRLREDLAKLTEEVGALSLVVGDVMKSDRAAAKRHDALLLGVGQLRETMARGASYAPELAALQAIAGSDPAFAPPLTALAAHAERGVKTRAQLREEYERILPAILRAAGGEPASSWWQAPFDRLSNLVSVRKIGDVAGDTPDAVAARAEFRLSEDDLAGAVTAIERLGGPPAEAARAWLLDARARLAVERALASLSAQALKAGATTP